MAALDTDVDVRLLVGDDPVQADAAARLVGAESCTIAPSVLLECEWVLRVGYQFAAPLIAARFRDLLALQNIEALAPVLTQHALQGDEAGLDFADALHAAQRRDGERFVTFDRQLARRAARAGMLAVDLLK